MFKKLLVAVDRSDAAARAAQSARELAAATGADVVLFHLREVVPSQGWATELELEDKDVARATVEEPEQEFGTAGVNVGTDLRIGEPRAVAREIVAAAERHGCDLVVMGSHGRSALGHLLLGSNAYKVLHTCQLPVLIVR